MSADHWCVIGSSEAFGRTRPMCENLERWGLPVFPCEIVACEHL